ncbi:MAG: DPP IV N-terminal domain-containing protein [Phycisphaerales bacterium]
MPRTLRLAAVFAASCVSACISTCALAQTYTPFKELPGHELVRRMQSAMGGIGEGGTVGDVRWDVGSRTMWFEKDGWKTLDLATGAIASAQGEPPESAKPSKEQRNGRGERRPPRGRQFTTSNSPDGSWTAVSEKGNLFLDAKEGGERKALTTDGNDDIKYGQASWVYGEELDQTTAMWWSPDSRFLAFYRFDESKVKDFYILGGWTEANTRVLSEAYPKPGAANPTAARMIHEIATGKTVAVDSFSAKSGAAEGAEYYLFNVRWTPDGSELIYSRTPRRQDVLDVLAASPLTGESRLVVQEKQDTWQHNRPLMRFLADGKRFIWESEKTGFKRYELRSLDGSLVAALTEPDSPVDAIVALDEDAGVLWYTAWSGDVAVQQQLHRAKLDGSGSMRITTGDFHHSNYRISPDGRAVVAAAQTTRVPRHDRVYMLDDAPAAGPRVAALGEGSTKGFATHGLTPSELFTCKAADGETTLYGKIQFPPAFDPARKYPVVVETYGGPTVRLVTDSFDAGDANTALGFLLVTVDNRGTPHRGKAFESAAYLRLGVVDADDQAAAVQHLAATRPYVDGTRVGITGHSYGGYMSAICVIRRGDVFHAAVAGAPPTDWRQYDTIYTERYMRTPQENAEGYDAGSCVKQAGKLTGKLLLLHGMMDDNVHPNNTFELAHALQSINRPFSMMLFPNSDHGIWSPANESVKWSFFIEALKPEAPAWGAAANEGGAP